MEERRRNMEKLKVKHDHKLTDILKVGIFAIFLLLPILMFIPSCAYYGVNKYAEPSTKQVENYQVVDFNQLFSLNGQNVDTHDVTIVGTDSNFNMSNVFAYYGINVSNLNDNNIYYIKFSAVVITGEITVGLFDNGVAQVWKDTSFLTTSYNFDMLRITNSEQNGEINYINFEIFNLTQMFGSGNEPTIAEFNEMFPNDYYDYTESKKIEIPDGTYSTRLTITDEIEYQWQNLWTLPVLNWVNENNFTFTINMFTSIFGISQRSFLTSYLTYILVMTAIYVIFDIVLSMFKLVTHLFNSKE